MESDRKDGLRSGGAQAMMWPRMFVGSCAVYVVMAACSGDEKLLTPGDDASAGGSSSMSRPDLVSPDGSSPVVDASVADSGFFDRLGSPVSDASAQDSYAQAAATVVTLDCDVLHEGASWAVLDMPGRTAESLAGVRVLAELVASEVPPAPFPVTHAPVDYRSWIVVGDGKVGAQCSCNGCEPVYSSVTFYVP